MNDFIAVEANYRPVHISNHPVTLAEFQAFLHETGRATPHGVKPTAAAAPGSSGLDAGTPGSNQPVVGVTQADAAAYCAWAGKHLGRTCRLPSTDELDSLMPHTTVTHAHGTVPDAGFWPHEQGQLAELRGGLKPVFLCEWTRDVEEDTVDLPEDRRLARIFYPPWLREGDNPLHAHAALLVQGSYNFVTFRVSYEG